MAEKYLKRQSLNTLFGGAETLQGSYIWNGILKALPLARSKARWILGKGDKIYSQQDSWLCQGPLINHPIYGRWAEQCTGRFGRMVSDYRIGSGWHDLDEISQDLLPLMLSLNATLINHSSDTLIQGDSLDGLYSVSSGYLSLVGQKEKPIWSKAQIPGLIPKVNIFFWLLLQDKILTLDNLAKKGQIIPNRCSLCKQDQEMVNHLFIHYPYSSMVWNLLTTDLGPY